MRTYIIGNEGIALCRKVPAKVSDGEIVVASKEELQVAPLNGKRLLALVERAARGRNAAEGWQPRGADRSAVVGGRGVARPGAASRPEAPLEAGRGDCDAASARGCNG